MRLIRLHGVRPLWIVAHTMPASPFNPIGKVSTLTYKGCFFHKVMDGMGIEPIVLQGSTNELTARYEHIHVP